MTLYVTSDPSNLKKATLKNRVSLCMNYLKNARRSVGGKYKGHACGSVAGRKGFVPPQL